MGSNFDKTKEILNGDKTKSGIAIKALAMDLDTKFDEAVNQYKEPDMEIIIFSQKYIPNDNETIL